MKQNNNPNQNHVLSIYDISPNCLPVIAMDPQFFKQIPKPTQPFFVLLFCCQHILAGTILSILSAVLQNTSASSQRQQQKNKKT
jgi:hypothetical protein